MPSKKKMTRRNFLKALAAGVAGASIVSAPGCAPVHFSRREVLGLAFSSKAERRKKVREKFVKTQIRAITGRPGKEGKRRRRPKRHSKPKPAKKPAKRSERSPFVRLGLDRKEGGTWSQLCRLYNWNVSRDIGKINLINHIAKKANAKPAQVMLAIKRRGMAWYHARALRSDISSLDKRIASSKERLNSPAKNPGERAKLKRLISSMRSRKAKAETDVRILDVLIAERKVSSDRKKKVRRTVIAVKNRFFTRKKLERLAGERK